MSHLHVQRLVVIEQEFNAVLAAVTYAAENWPRIHTADLFVMNNVEASRIRLAVNNVENTYLVRSFSEFEAMLREHLHRIYPPIRIPFTAEALINRVSVRSSVPNAWRNEAHTVRLYRNAVVHQSRVVVEPVSFRAATSALCRFLSVLSDLS